VSLWEVESLCRRLFSELDRVVKALEGLDEVAVNWRPPAQNANSLLVLATHTVAAAEDHVVHRLCGEEVARSRPAEFVATGCAAHIRERAEAVKRRITDALARLDPARLEALRDTPDGKRPVGDSLVLAVAHAAEHAGQMELTRDLWRATQERG
jgi:uncharacterized damage-inducible protein DinB